MISIIVAVDPNNVIGLKNDIPWKCKEDMKLFKERTTGSTVIMGRKTWESLPRRPLPNRLNVVLTSTGLYDEWRDILCYPSLELAIKEHKNAFIIGGEQVYKKALELDIVDRIIMTKIHKCYEGDRFFPKISGWKTTEVEKYDEFDVLHLEKGFTYVG
jgi:dihydrofolate reductase